MCPYICINKNHKRMIHIIREISKLCMFVVLWGFPLVLSRWNEDNRFLWFFALSFIATVGVFGHYEDLERIDGYHFDTDEIDDPYERQ